MTLIEAAALNDPLTRSEVLSLLVAPADGDGNEDGDEHGVGSVAGVDTDT